jgi:hypothetical protein
MSTYVGYKRKGLLTMRAVGAVACAIAVATAAGSAAAGPPGKSAAIVNPAWATGLSSPRGLKFGPDGYLYVAEGGVGGTNPAPLGDFGNCTAGLNGPGEYYGSNTGSRISRIDTTGAVTTFVDNLPSSGAPIPGPDGLVSGVADLAFVGDTMYAVLAGAGCSHGVPDIPNALIRVNTDHTWTQVADLGAYLRAHPVADATDPMNGDFEPDGTFYSLIAVRGDLYTVEPNQGEMLKVTTEGAISRVIDFSAALGHVVPTVVAYHGNFYVSNLGRFPQDIGSATIWKVTPSGNIKVDTTGFNMVLGLVFDGRDRMYVLEMSAEQAVPTPFTGRVTRVDPSGKRTVIADGSDGLFFPTGIAIGPDGNLYVSNQGFGLGAGTGTIAKIDLTN